MGVQDVPQSSVNGQYGYATYQRPATYAGSYPHQSYSQRAPYQQGAPGYSQQQQAYQRQSSDMPSQPYASQGTQAAGRSKKRKANLPAPEVIDLTGDEPPKKQRVKSATPDFGDVYDFAGETGAPAPKGRGRYTNSAMEKAPRKKGPKSEKVVGDDGKPKKKTKAKDEEKRLKRWRTHAPSTYQEVKDRALTQRMFALDRQRNTGNPDHPIETVSLAGTTGNVYTITIDKVPSCDCPHAKKGNQCKHVVYVLSRVLRVRAELEYQLAFLSSELREIFGKAPPLPTEMADGDKNNDGNRKPIEGECPICCVDFEPGSGEKVVYCRAACGNNIHSVCFDQWAQTKRGGAVPCPFCRTTWESDSDQAKDLAKNVAKAGPKNGEGYVNVANQLGISGRRDYSTYHSHWVRNQARYGHIAWDEDGVMGHEY